jgi:hypothetical protein
MKLVGLTPNFRSRELTAQSFDIWAMVQIDKYFASRPRTNTVIHLGHIITDPALPSSP